MNLSFILWLSASMAIFLSAATASRYYVSTNNILILLFSLGLYCLGNLMMVRLMREGGLGLPFRPRPSPNCFWSISSPLPSSASG